MCIGKCVLSKTKTIELRIPVFQIFLELIVILIVADYVKLASCL